ncbi:MAG: GDSL-type esterase/lipase family protein [Thermoleophilaceae bacterium]
MPTFPTGEQRVPEPPRGPRRRARDGLRMVAVAVLLLVLFEGTSLRSAGQEMQPGWERDVVLAVGRPTAWVADRLPFHELSGHMFGWIGTEQGLGRSGGFDQPLRAAREGPVPPVSPDSFDPADLGGRPIRPRPLRTVLVTGDSMSMPLDVEVARGLAGRSGVWVVRDPHLGTGVSKSGFVDWGKLSSDQVRRKHPDAIVVFIGANEGFPMPGAGGRQVSCCGPDWAAVYAFRVRRMMNTYRQRGQARVYWLTLPLPRLAKRQQIAHAVNQAIEVASVPYRSQVRVLDMVPLFTPGGRYRDAMTVSGRKQIVREPDGIHLNETGSRLAAARVLAGISRDFGR